MIQFTGKIEYSQDLQDGKYVNGMEPYLLLRNNRSDGLGYSVKLLTTAYDINGVAIASSGGNFAFNPSRDGNVEKRRVKAYSEYFTNGNRYKIKIIAIDNATSDVLSQKLVLEGIFGQYSGWQAYTEGPAPAPAITRDVSSAPLEPLVQAMPELQQSVPPTPPKTQVVSDQKSANMLYETVGSGGNQQASTSNNNNVDDQTLAEIDKMQALKVVAAFGLAAAAIGGAAYAVSYFGGKKKSKGENKTA